MPPSAARGDARFSHTAPNCRTCGAGANDSTCDGGPGWVDYLRLEACDEFFSGHYGARAFEALERHHEAWQRAQCLAVHEGLVEEWRPRGASEFILIDQVT